MKNKKKLIIRVLLISLIVFLGFSIGEKLIYKKEVAERIKSVPEFSFKTIKGELFTEQHISRNQPKLFVYFNSECGSCHSEAKQISKHLDKLKNVQILFVSYQESHLIKQFAKQYELLIHNNIIFLEDEKLQFATIFDAKSIPYILLYSKDNQLVQKFKGVTKISTIARFLN